MAVEGVFYVLAYVSDLERSKRFYRDKLGWQLGTDEAGVAGFQFGSGYLVLHVENRPAAERIYRGGLSVSVKVTDAAAEHARLKSAGVNLGALRDEPWGERTFEFADPDGYRWAYGQNLAG